MSFVTASYFIAPPEPEVRRERIKGWPGYYAGDDGEIYSLKSGDFEPLAKWEGGRPRCRYWKVTLRRRRRIGRGVCPSEKRNFYVHDLVARAFLGRRPRRRPGVQIQASHKSGDRFDNRARNLAWKTKHANEADKRRHGTVARVCGERNGAAKVSAEHVEAIRTSLLPDSSLASIYHLSRSQVRRIRRGESWAT